MNRTIITVVGKDTVGIIAKVSAVCADYGVNIRDISQSVLDEYFAMIMLAEIDGLTIKFAEFSDRLAALGFDRLPICMAKTQYSFSDDATKLGAPEGFTVTVRSVKVSAGAGFIVALTGDIMTMPGLPKVPAAERIDVDENGKITGLF